MKSNLTKHTFFIGNIETWHVASSFIKITNKNPKNFTGVSKSVPIEMKENKKVQIAWGWPKFWPQQRWHFKVQMDGGQMHIQAGMGKIKIKFLLNFYCLAAFIYFYFDILLNKKNCCFQKNFTTYIENSKLFIIRKNIHLWAK